MTQKEKFIALLDEMGVFYEINEMAVIIPTGATIEFDFDANGDLNYVDIIE